MIIVSQIPIFRQQELVYNTQVYDIAQTIFIQFVHYSILHFRIFRCIMKLQKRSESNVLTDLHLTEREVTQ